MKHIVILGTGFAALDTYRHVHKLIHRRTDVRITIVGRNNYFLFTPMLHEIAAGSVGRSHIVQPVREVVRCCLESFHQAEIEKVDIEKKQIHTSTGVVSYDYLVVGLGSRVNYFGVKGAKQHTLALKTMQDAVALRNHIISVFEQATKEKNTKKRKQLLNFGIIGAGPTGVELAGQMADLVYHAFRPLYQEIDYKEVKITLVHRNERVLHVFREKTSVQALKRLKKIGITVKLKTGVVAVDEQGVELDSGSRVESKTVVWAAGTASVAPDVLDAKWLNKRGQIKVRPELHIPDHPNVFALGDCAALDGDLAPFAPATAQAAQDAAKIVARNVNMACSDVSEEKYKSFIFKQKGYIMPIGDWFAVAEIGPFTFSGRVAWWMRRTVFIQHLNSWMNRLRVTIDWTLHSFMHRDTSEL